MNVICTSFRPFIFYGINFYINVFAWTQFLSVSEPFQQMILNAHKTVENAYGMFMQTVGNV